MYSSAVGTVVTVRCMENRGVRYIEVNNVHVQLQYT